MPRSRPASNPVSYHKYTNQYYVTRGGKRIYLGCDKEEALKQYHHLGLGYCANVAAGFMLAQFVKYLRMVPVENDVQLNLLGLELSVE